MIYGYARVSTKAQEKSGNSLADQQSKLMKAGADVVYADAFTGTTRERPELKKLLSEIQEGDTLIVTKLDRVARSIKCGADLIDELIDKGVTVHILNMGVLDNTPAGRLMRNMFLAFAEFERDMIVERTTEGKNIAREVNPDFKEGRPSRYNKGEVAYFEKYQKQEITREQAGKKFGIAGTTFYKHYREWLEKQ